MVKLIYHKVKMYLDLTRHRRDWRHQNSHNRTIASTFFPKDKVKVGNHSYGDLHIISYSEQNEGLEIGHYVSIANNVQFLLGGNHYYKRFTNYPFIAKFHDLSHIETWSKGKTIIEDDVWIATEAFIMAGVRIGRGAIVGARAVVTKDVPPYAIVAGNPAQFVRFRFDENAIQQASRIDFSRLKPEDISKNIDLYKQETGFDGMISGLGLPLRK